MLQPKNLNATNSEEKTSWRNNTKRLFVAFIRTVSIAEAVALALYMRTFCQNLVRITMIKIFTVDNYD